MLCSDSFVNWKILLIFVFLLYDRITPSVEISHCYVSTDK